MIDLSRGGLTQEDSRRCFLFLLSLPIPKRTHLRGVMATATVALSRSEYYRVIRHTVNSVEGLIEEVQQSAEHVGTSALEQLRGQVVGEVGEVG